MRSAERRARAYRAYRSKPHVPLDGDDRERLDHLSQLGVAVRRLDARCADLVTQIDAALRYRNSTPARMEGWRLEAVVALLIAAFFAESFIVATFADGPSFGAIERVVLSVIVAGCLVGTGFLIGELLRHRRIAREVDALSPLAITGACIAALSLLATVWSQQVGNAGHAAQPGDLKSLTFGILAVALVLVPVAASYHREAGATARARRRVASLQQHLHAQERLSDRKHDEHASALFEFNLLRAERAAAADAPRNGARSGEVRRSA